MHHRPHWSYSSISQYLACPLRYYFQRVLCLPQPTVSSSLVLGSSVHAALAEYHRAIQHDEPTSVDKLHRTFEECWTGRENQTRITFKDGETPKDTFDQGIALVEMYLKEPPPQRIVSIEQEIISPVHNSRGEYLETPLVAVADLITEVDEQLTVREIKTSSRAYSATETETSLQPTCYVNAVQEVFGFPATVEYTVLIKTKTPKLQRLTAERTNEDLGRLGDIVENIERAVQANIFYPVENALNCSTCPYRQPCRDWGRNSDHRGLITLGTNATEES
jgi:CRISPR/Cas system-associated exonuclease Cas4 (RecB family)